MDLSFLTNMDSKTLFTVAMTLFASMVTMIASRKVLSIDNFDSFLTMRLARLGMLLISPLLYPYFVGRRMRYRLFRANQKSKARFAKKQIRRREKQGRNAYPHDENLARAATKLANTKRQNYYDDIWDGASTCEGDVANRIGTWFLGLIPIAAIAVVTWVPGVREIDLGVTEAFSTAMNTAGEWLVSFSGK